jgi:guanine deaminase
MIIAEGTNRVRVTNDLTVHAGVVAIRAACRKIGSLELKNCEIPASSEPCPRCFGAMYWARASDAAHAGFDDSRIYGEISQPHTERSVPIIPLMREQALEPFRAWAVKSDKIPY